MKLKIFIGSSTEGKLVADAIDSRLQVTAEPKVWAAGAFGLSEMTAASLVREVHESDFAVFVFTPDDVAEIRGQLLRVPRDNVIYELGLFSGALGPERCFFVTPLECDIHLPTDLLGMTAGHYDANRRDGSLDAAVNPVCTRITQKLAELGFRHTSTHSQLTAMTVRYECSNWIAELHERLRSKDDIFASMVAFCQQKPVNKRILFGEKTTGSYGALAASIVANPETSDCSLVYETDRAVIHRGHAQAKFLDALLALKHADRIADTWKMKLLAWAKGLTDPDPSLASQIASFEQRSV